MKHKTLLWISAALTVFTLILIVGVVTTVRRVNAAAEIVATQDPAAAQVMTERESAYREMIAQANERLLQAQQSQEELQAQLNALQNNNAVSTTVTPQQAAEIAALYMGRTDLYSVENSTVNDQPAYLVTFSSGDQVFISLDGQVLSVVSAQQITAGSQNINSLSGSFENEEHERENHAGQDD
jgi:hypothetical protein